MADNVAASVQVRVGADITGFMNGMRQVKGQLSNLGNEANTAGAAVKRSFGASLTKGINDAAVAAVPLALALRQGVKTASDFNAIMVDTAAKTGASAKEMELVRQTALKMGRDTMFGATDAATAMQELMLSGSSAADAIKMLPSVMHLAMIGNIGLGESADAVTDVLAQFNLTGDEAVMVTNAMARAAAVSSAEVNDVIRAFQRGGPAAQLFGLSVEETAAAFAVLAEAGLKGEEAGTNLKSMFNALLNSPEASKALKELGVSLADAGGKIRDFDDIVVDLNKALSGKTEIEKARYIKELAGSYGMLSLAALLSSTSLEEIQKRMNNTPAAAETAAQKMEAFAAKVDALKASLETAIIKGFTPFMDKALTPMVSGLGDVIDKVGDFAESYPDLTQTVLSLSGAMVVASFGAKLLASGLGLVALKGALVVGVLTLTTMVVGQLNDVIQQVDAINAVMQKDEANYGSRAVGLQMLREADKNALGKKMYDEGFHITNPAEYLQFDLAGIVPEKYRAQAKAWGIAVDDGGQIVVETFEQFVKRGGMQERINAMMKDWPNTWEKIKNIPAFLRASGEEWRKATTPTMPRHSQAIDLAQGITAFGDKVPALVDTIKNGFVKAVEIAVNEVEQIPGLANQLMPDLYDKQGNKRSPVGDLDKITNEVIGSQIAAGILTGLAGKVEASGLTAPFKPYTPKGEYDPALYSDAGENAADLAVFITQFGDKLKTGGDALGATIREALVPSPNLAAIFDKMIRLSPDAMALLSKPVQIQVNINQGRGGGASRYEVEQRDSGGSGRAGNPYLIGTGAQPELFVPSTAGHFFPAGSYGGDTYNFNVYGGNPYETVNAIEREMRRRGRRGH